MTSWLGSNCIPVISDVHGCISGLNAVLADINALGCHTPPIFLGDLFWTGDRKRDPRQVLEKVMSMDAVAFIKGNTDDLLMSAGLQEWDTKTKSDGLEKSCMMSFRRSLSETEILFIDAFIDQYTFNVSGQSVIAAHAAPGSYHDGLNADLPRHEWLKRFGNCSSYLVSGHLHRNFIHTIAGLTHICVGAVGRAGSENDGIAEYAILSESAGGGLCVFFQRVAFQ
jgi:predicted phosphodiesterase